MSAAIKIDAFGFPESAMSFGCDIIPTANEVGFAVQRCAALLRSLNYQLLNGTGKEQVSMGDIQALVELALQALPDPNGEIFDRFDQCEIKVDQAFRSMQTYRQTMTAMLEALEIAANLGSTLDELSAAGDSAYAAATTLPDGQRHWDAFCEQIVRRGLSVEMIDLGPRLGPSTKIHTPESLKHSKAVQRKIASFTAAVHEEAAARAPKRKPAKRRQGKA